MGCLDGSTASDAAKYGQQFRRLDVSQGAGADPGEHVLYKADPGALGMAGTHLGLVHSMQPFTCHCLEGARQSLPPCLGPRRLVPCCLGLLLRLARGAGVHTLGHLLALLLTLLSCRRQADLGPRAKALPVRLAAHPPPQAPPAPAIGLALQGQPCTVVHGLGLTCVRGLPQGLLDSFDRQEVYRRHTAQLPVTDRPTWAVVRIVVRSNPGGKGTKAAPSGQRKSPKSLIT